LIPALRVEKYLNNTFQRETIMMKRGIIEIPDQLIFDITSFIHPFLHLLLFSKAKCIKNGIGRDQIPAKLPLSLLQKLLLNNQSAREEFEDVFLSYKFRISLKFNIVTYGDFSAIQWFRAKDVSWYKDTLMVLAGRGELQTLKWAISNGCELNRSSFLRMICSIESNDNILQWASGYIYFTESDHAVENVLENAARKKQFSIIIWMMTNFPVQMERRNVLDKMLQGAVYCGHIDMLEWIELNFPDFFASVRSNSVDSIKYVCIAAGSKNLPMLFWMKEHGFSFDHESIATAAAESGSLETLQFLRSLNCPWTDRVCQKAIKGGNFEILQWATTNNCPYILSKLAISACQCLCTNEDILQWLLEQNCLAIVTNHSILISKAMAFGNFRFIQWIRSNGTVEWNSDIKKRAAAFGNLEALKWAVEIDEQNGLIRDFYILSINAAAGGHLQILEWLYAKYSCFLDPQICVVAATKGHVHVLEWAVNNGCEMDKQLCCIAAIKKSQILVLLWMKRIAHHYSARRVSSVWHKSFGYYTDSDYDHPSLCAAENADLEVFQWIHINGCPWSMHTYKALTNRKPKDFLEWAVKNGCPTYLPYAV